MTDGALIARVVPDVTGLDKQFDYVVPPELVDAVRVGSIVRVPLGPRKVRAWVVALSATSDIENLKPVTSWSGIGPDEAVIDLARWAAHRWAGRLRPFLLAASPAALVKKAVSSPPRMWHPAEQRVLDPLGGVIRLPPCTDPLPTLLAACSSGPILVVQPDVDGAGLLAARLRGAGLRVAVTPRDWAAAAGGVDVVIGARAAVWSPCPGLAGIVVIDEHDESLQDERSPTWHARDVAVERARRAAVPCWLVSPTPTLEALAWAGSRASRPSRLEERNGWPFVAVVDRSVEELPVASPVSRALLEACRDPHQRVVCVLNTKGRARRLVCRACRAQVTCAACHAGVSQARDATLHCSRCEATRPALCNACGSTRLAGIGIGTARLRDELAAAIRRPVVEISADAADDAVASAPPDAVFLGTEAVLHRVRSASTVVFVDFDDELLAPRYRAAEEAMSLVVRAARLVGARASGGRVLLQTDLPRHEVVQAALHADPSRLVEPERERRLLLGLPPARAIAAVSGTAASSWLQPCPLGLELSGPAQGRWLVRALTWDDLADGLQTLGPRPRGVRVEVDPHRV
ncbi:MAG: hypothetical protein F2934_03160 [Actinobacteria bacterium]|uniref:Unannotated protein n=1 Tax=freshwater metagenome TaxID=449393 RepID=A0A6J7TWA1_9ZZZZ|nr:hypothetical protein [Actinomycetota bacterium]MSZ03071.1 hypothetical protein [Actinomycetota bacterium]MTB06113.1 hypothetical protein [Actinomycetota bacterium]